jgi:hypothetical protein
MDKLPAPVIGLYEILGADGRRLTEMLEGSARLGRAHAAGVAPARARNSRVMCA